ncbi:MAG: exodeoxyribonuclease I [Candidatus Saccharimonadales bacterium]
MATTFYFYDLETSGFNPRSARIMQFGGQRTDMALKPIGEPDNILVRLSEDVLPDPDAVLVTGITPQTTRSEGITEAEFVKYLTSQVFRPGTIAVGFNNIRFDNEFIRFTLWRNFCDAYEWQWKDDRATWDLLDAVRMTRALRPEGIQWPFAPDGKPSNRLELLSSVNKLDHSSAHDALSDVRAVISLAELLRLKQSKLFDYLLNLRDKTKVAAFVTKGHPLVYTSGRYPSEYEKTTVAVMVAAHPGKSAALMYDLRINPEPYTTMTPAELAAKWSLRGKDAPYFPVKVLSYNRSPAVAPLSVLDAKSTVRLKIDSKGIDKNFNKLKAAADFGDKLVVAMEIMHPKKQENLVTNEQKVDEQLYDGFVPSADKSKMSLVRAANPQQLADLDPDFADERLVNLLRLYKARNYPASLTTDDQEWWEKFRRQRLLSGGEASRAALYFKRLEELSLRPGLKSDDKYLLEELKLYGQSVIPDF